MLGTKGPKPAREWGGGADGVERAWQWLFAVYVCKRVCVWYQCRNLGQWKQ